MARELEWSATEEENPTVISCTTSVFDIEWTKIYLQLYTSSIREPVLKESALFLEVVAGTEIDLPMKT